MASREHLSSLWLAAPTGRSLSPDPKAMTGSWALGSSSLTSQAYQAEAGGRGHKEEGGAGRGRVESQSVQLEPSEHGHGCESVQKEEAHGGLVLAASRVWVSFLRP